MTLKVSLAGRLLLLWVLLSCNLKSCRTCIKVLLSSLDLILVLDIKNGAYSSTFILNPSSNYDGIQCHEDDNKILLCS